MRGSKDSLFNFSRIVRREFLRRVVRKQGLQRVTRSAAGVRKCKYKTLEGRKQIVKNVTKQPRSYYENNFNNSIIDVFSLVWLDRSHLVWKMENEIRVQQGFQTSILHQGMQMTVNTMFAILELYNINIFHFF